VDALTALLATAERFLAGGAPSVDTTHLALVKVVRKHWGEERWLVPEGNPFGFKVITVLAGRRTSLQYHRHKEEAHLVLSGEGRLRLAGDPGLPLTEHALVPGQVAHIRPGTVHRVEAVTDLVLVEVSTPELDDVVRIEDDLGRGDGRIEAEHRGP
jgi:mannose-6-phosphate isomerase